MTPISIRLGLKFYPRWPRPPLRRSGSATVALVAYDV